LTRSTTSPWESKQQFSLPSRHDPTPSKPCSHGNEKEHLTLALAGRCHHERGDPPGRASRDPLRRQVTIISSATYYDAMLRGSPEVGISNSNRYGPPSWRSSASTRRPTPKRCGHLFVRPQRTADDLCRGRKRLNQRAVAVPGRGNALAAGLDPAGLLDHRGWTMSILMMGPHEGLFPV
jgi:hypothetical protein